MKQQLTSILWLGILTAGLLLHSSFQVPATLTIESGLLIEADGIVKQEALEVLRAKCNVCHRKQNPFMVFNTRNMTKRSSRIYRAVFVEQKMPKGDAVRLSKAEYAKLEKWLSTQNIK